MPGQQIPLDPIENKDNPAEPIESPIKNSKSAQARINGAKSTGAKSPAGKEKTSWNTLKHGFRSDRDVIHGESQQTYNDLAQTYHRYFTPQTIIEHDLVSNLISARWRYRRAQMMECCTFNITMARSEAEWDEEFESLPTEYRHTLAFYGSLKSKDHNLNIESLSRWEERFDGRWRRSILLFQKLRGKKNPLPAMDILIDAEEKLPNNYGLYPEPWETDDADMELPDDEEPIVDFTQPTPEPEPSSPQIEQKCTPDPPPPAAPIAPATPSDNGSFFPLHAPSPAQKQAKIDARPKSILPLLAPVPC